MKQLKTEFLIPVKHISFQDNKFVFLEKLRITSSDRPLYEVPISQLEQILVKLSPGKYHSARSKSKEIKLLIYCPGTASSKIDHESYQLEITQESIIISCKDSAGVYYAVQTLRELLLIYGRRIPCCTIDDYPDFKRRGIMLDVSRGKIPRLQTLKNLVELLAFWKLNEFQLYMENSFKFEKHPEPSAGFSPYSAKDILELQQHCKIHHVRLVPCLNSLGHMEKTLSIKKYMHLAETPGAANYPGGTTLNPENPGSLRLMEDFYSEFLPLFEATDFNVCCDEAQINDKAGVPKSIRIAKYINKLASLVEKHGKRFNIWADCTNMVPSPLPYLPQETIYLDYAYIPNRLHTEQSPDRAHRLAATGKHFLICPGSSSWHTHGTFLNAAIVNISQIADEARVLSADGLMLTDWGDTGHRQPLGCSLYSFAYTAAQAWGGEQLEKKSFSRRFCARTWGDYSGKMALALEKLGRNSTIAAGAEKLYAGKWDTIYKRLYFALIAPFNENESILNGLDPRTPLKQIYESFWITSLRNISENACRKIIEATVNFDVQPESNGCAPFIMNFIEDLQLAERMDVLAAKRVLFAKKLSRKENAREASTLIEDSLAVHKSFAKNWLKRNRTSRLNDNLKVFSKNICELKEYV